MGLSSKGFSIFGRPEKCFWIEIWIVENLKSKHKNKEILNNYKKERNTNIKLIVSSEKETNWYEIQIKKLNIPGYLFRTGMDKVLTWMH